MAVPIEKNFAVKTSPDRVWAFLTDPYRVAKCLPGAAITEQLDDQTYAGTITVKVGPVSASYKGQVRFERLDQQSRTAELTGRGMDVRGKGGADMRMTSHVIERGPDETEVTVTSEVTVTGILAQFGRGMIVDVSDQLFEQFTEAMRAELEGGGGGGGGGGDGARPEAGGNPEGTAAFTAAASKPEALDVGALGASVLKRSLARLVRRRWFWAGVAVVALAVYWLWLR